VLMLSPLDSLRRDDAGEAGAELSDEAELVHDLGGVYCGLYEQCRHTEALAIFRLVNSTGRKSATPVQVGTSGQSNGSD